MALPTVISDGLCPVSRPASGSKAPKGSFVPIGFGEGPVYLTGQGIGWYPDQEVRLIVDPAYSDIVLIRGKQLNGARDAIGGGSARSFARNTDASRTFGKRAPVGPPDKRD